MKKLFSFLFCCFLFSILFAEGFRIQDYKINIKGRTKESVLNRYVGVAKGAVFGTEEDLQNYIKTLEQNYWNLRFFENITINYDILDTDSENITNVFLTIDIDDGLNIIVLPAPKISQPVEGTEFSIKTKIKNSNIFGSFQALNAELNLNWAKDFRQFSPEAGINFMIPFYHNTITFMWGHNYNFNMTTIDNSPFRPEWNLSQNFAIILPIFKNWSFSVLFSQYYIRDLTYENYGDDLYFQEAATVLFSKYLFSTDIFGATIFSPRISFLYNWDFNGISPDNLNLFATTILGSLPITSSKINYKGNYKEGLSLSFTPLWSINIGRAIRDDIFTNCWNKQRCWNAGIQFDFLWYQPLIEMGLKTRVHGFYYFNTEHWYHDYPDPFSLAYEVFDDRLRGIRDGNVKNGIYSASSDCALVVNIDIPFTLFVTDFDKFNMSLIKAFNVETQMAFFLDVAMGHSRYTGDWFNPKNGFYSAGMEVIVYPKKWPSYQFRASLGFDIGRAINFVDKMRGLGSIYELSIGFGTFY